jgi:cytochrome b561
MTRLLNSDDSYGLVAVVLHWLVAAGVMAMFASGLWMTTLDYYHPWYHRAPALHGSCGVAVVLLVLLRLLWSLASRAPRPLTGRFFTALAHLVHALLHLTPLLVAWSGYLVVTADGKGLAFFSLFELPPLLDAASERADTAGSFHLWLAWSLILLSLAHAGAAIYHQLVLRDNALLRITGYSCSS